MWGRFFVFLVVAALSAQAATDVDRNFRSGLNDYFQHGEFTPEFKEFLSTVNLTHAFRNEAESYTDRSLICDVCNVVVDVLLGAVRSGLISQNLLQRVVTALCTSLIYESQEVCDGAISSNIDIILYIVNARPDRKGDTVCGILAQSYGCTASADPWTVDIAEGTTEINKGVISETDPFKVLHLADLHYDGKYAPGSLGSCADPVCCTAGTVATNEADVAGYWGDYRDCDTPLHAIVDALDHISEVHTDIDYVYYTGDSVSHRVWDTSYAGNTADIDLMNQLLEETFPNIPVYPVLGNHEPHPLNVFAPLEIEDEGLSTQWLFDEVADIWGEFLGEDARATLRKGGFYTILVRPGFRIIALNSNAAYTMNWWLIYDDVDPYGQLQWLADTLYEAEQNGEKVHILSHLPSNDGTCYRVWSNEYRRIVDRFAGTITGAFNGHTHRDELIVYHNKDNPTEANSIAWNGGSVTTYSNKNPNYKLYEVDSESFEVLDYAVWAYNITAANLTPDQAPNWFELYTLKAAYGLSGTTPSDIRDLVLRMAEDHSLVAQYYEYSVRQADTSMAWGCDSSCQLGLVCNMVLSAYGDDTQCSEITAIW